ncbi:YybH family protein [Rubinisphaera margarita]|uniref:YybH family protein n=1 Tax=Rubinisphaera margarita TaxID=2909586 RepID=UPI001EE9073A|nr:SgcJ/EcaC family oxidoreductase [Rubinisphaera margarita]MCG6156380.1 SgcJ/EcaC family oxidoreductase [Rubinisphaera margarita]
MRVLRALFAFCLLSCFTTMAIAEENASGSQDVIRKQIQSYVEYFNQGDTDKIAQLWAEDGVFANLTLGGSTQGRTQIVAELSSFLSTQPGARLTGSVDEIKLLGETAAKVTGSTQLVLEDGTAETSSFIILFVQIDDEWLIESITETSQPIKSAREELAELEWLIGDWKDQTEGADVATSCRWSRGEVYLIRTFSVSLGETVSEGTEIIGWDPQVRQIRSWSFFSDGSFGSGFWTKNGDKWVVQSVHTLAEGDVADSLRVISDIAEDSMRVQLASHSINGELQPAREPVTVTRIASETAAANEGGQE